MRNSITKKSLYRVITVEDAKSISFQYLKSIKLDKVITFGLPEIDDRYHIWRIALLDSQNRSRVGEVVIDSKTSLVVESKSTKK